MSYLIDSDVLINLMEADALTEQLFDALTPYGVSISAITYIEAFQGIIEHPEDAQFRFERLLEHVPVLPVNEHVAQRCAYLRRTFLNRGKRVRPRALDLLIAATALEHNLTLVTRNDRDYRDIPGAGPI